MTVEQSRLVQKTDCWYKKLVGGLFNKRHEQQKFGSFLSTPAACTSYSTKRNEAHSVREQIENSSGILPCSTIKEADARPRWPFFALVPFAKCLNKNKDQSSAARKLIVRTFVSFTQWDRNLLK